MYSLVGMVVVGMLVIQNLFQTRGVPGLIGLDAADLVVQEDSPEVGGVCLITSWYWTAQDQPGKYEPVTISLVQVIMTKQLSSSYDLFYIL